jgi:iron complex transport system ATP-binding protein
MSEPLAPQAWTLECSNLTVCRGGRVVLHDVNLTLRSGESLSLIGPNGAGKTTLMLAMLGLLRPAAGQVRLNGVPLHELAPRSRGRFAAYVPQVVERLSGFTVYQVVAGGRFPHLRPLRPLSAADRAAISRALRDCGLADLAGRPVHTLSGGERQKVLLAAAFAQDAQALFLDEPTTALDPAVQLDLARLLRNWLCRARSLVVISHDLQWPAIIGGRVVALKEGTIVADGPAGQVLDPGRLAQVYGAEFEHAQTASGTALIVPRWKL